MDFISTFSLLIFYNMLNNCLAYKMRNKALSGYFALSEVPYDIKLLVNQYRKNGNLGVDKDYYTERNIMKRAPILKLNSNLQEQPCHLQPITLNTYTHERGTQTPNHVVIQQCQGGQKNPENYQCQPTGTAIECFKTINSNQNIDYLGIRIDTSCEEKCICARKDCKNKKIETLICPQGYTENPSTCLCEAAQKLNAKSSMFFRNRALYSTVWTQDLNEMCRKYANVETRKRSIEVGQSFILKKIDGVVHKLTRK